MVAGLNPVLGTTTFLNINMTFLGALNAMFEGKTVTRDGLTTYRVQKGIMDTDLIEKHREDASPDPWLTAFIKAYDHGERGCTKEDPELIVSFKGIVRTEKKSPISFDMLLATDWRVVHITH